MMRPHSTPVSGPSSQGENAYKSVDGSTLLAAFLAPKVRLATRIELDAAIGKNALAKHPPICHSEDSACACARPGSADPTADIIQRPQGSVLAELSVPRP